jgi:hypothetical protein
VEYDDEWGIDDERRSELEDLLYESVIQEDYTEGAFLREVGDMGPPDTWESANIIIDGDGDYSLHVVDATGDEHIFSVGSVRDERGIDDIYEWMEDQDIDFDVIYEG